MKTSTIELRPGQDIRRSLYDAEIEDSAATLIQLFSGSTSEAGLKALLRVLHTVLPQSQIVGCTASAVISNGGIHEDLVLLNIWQFESSSVSLSWASFASESNPDSLSLGHTLARQVAEDDTQLLLCYSAGDCLNAEDLARGLIAFVPNTPLGGCIASARQSGQQGLVCIGQRVEAAAAVVVAIAGNELSVNLHHSKDWMMLGTPMEVTSSEGNILREINDTPAQSVYTRYLGEESCYDLEAACLRFPLLLERNGRVLARLGNHVDRRDGSIRFWGNLAPGEKVRFGLLNPVSAIDDFRKVIESLENHRCEVLLVFPSEARKLMMQSLTEDELGRLQEIAGTQGIFTPGQYFYGPDQPDFLHYSHVVISIAEGNPSEPLTLTQTGLDAFSPDTLEMRAISHLVNTTARELEEANQSLEKQANTDQLTGIYNRHKAGVVLDQEYRRAQRYGRPLSLIMIDIDDFKQINDHFGHQVGDQVLIKTTRVIQPVIRETDWFVRWGGEEFLIICPETDLKGTAEIAERLRVAVANAPILEQRPVTISVGVACHVKEDTLDTLLECADKALYQAKAQGKNQTVSWIR